MTLGIIAGVSIIIISIITTGLYTFIANQYFDKKQALIIQELQNTGITDKMMQGCHE